ncbi:MAG: cytochrome-c oxidase, cbb3-type subunit I [Kiritimatiellae bacterium]|nr:cytochrome-c oxidase, cbb3-type subunit I [Kiritimatiellia bacterium]
MSNIETFRYDNRIVRNFALATVIWGVVGFLVGLFIAIELFVPGAGGNLAELSYGRLRPLHTNAVIFAFVGNGIFMGVYYSLQRLCKARMFSDLLSALHFWGWQLIIVLAAITLPLGISQSKEYAELEWPIDVLITVVWVLFAINVFGTILRRRERHIYVAIWFYIGTIVAVAMLHIVNSIEIPVSLTRSYPVFAGVQDALTQWWYGHNAVAFFLTTPYLGLMYYFLPKAANRPVYSYRLSIIHFWSLIFVYIWAGPHHLLYSSLPDWAQSLGMVFSIMLIAPSWGGMLNGLLTLRGAWDRVRQDPVLKFMVVAVTAYGMATLEGPLLSIKTVNALSHYTDWTIAHVHTGALGWNGFLTFGVLYWLVPKLYNTKLWSTKLATTHFWIGLLGIVFYVVPLYWAGIAQGLMWQQFTPEGTLQYPNFLETVVQILPMYKLRAVGGALYLSGAILMVINLIATARAGSFEPETEAQAAALTPPSAGVDGPNRWGHRALERKPVLFIVLSLVAVAIGGLVEMVPMAIVKSNIPTIPSVKPYTPLELEGRDRYVSEGCYVCHSQMIRPFRAETERYGAYSKAGEFVYDHPFQWGSKRTGPDLHRVGGKYSDSWHFLHMEDPRQMSVGSIMPAYPWMLHNKLKVSQIQTKMAKLKAIGTPYTDEEIAAAPATMMAQAEEIAARLRTQLPDRAAQIHADREIIAMIAYLQRLGTDIRKGGEALEEVAAQ